VLEVYGRSYLQRGDFGERETSTWTINDGLLVGEDEEIILFGESIPTILRCFVSIGLA